MTYSKEIVREWLDQVAERAKEYPEWVDVFERCYTDTLDNTVEILEDGSTFVLTGDIPAMWLRDSTAQLRPYLHVAKRDPRLRQTIAGLVKRQMTLILKDPYANSFNIEENWKGHHETDHTDLNGWIWERKYEVDSLCYPLQLAYLSCGRKQVRLANLMRLLLQRPRKSFIFGQWNKTTRIPLIALFGIQIVRKTRW